MAFAKQVQHNYRVIISRCSSLPCISLEVRVKVGLNVFRTNRTEQGNLLQRERN